MEAFEGVVILATNLQANLDDAFIRRLHFIIDFPFPEAPDRERIWRVTYPADTPLDEEVDFTFLARQFRIAGGNIKNIVVASAFLAARDGASVGMRHILHATRREYQKLGRLIDESKFSWPQLA
jgi:ATP-dependent 26S proteasome regulatory subunit